jgi:hypothetical protein
MAKMEYPYFNYNSRKMVVSERITIDYKHNCLLELNGDHVEAAHSLEVFREYLWSEWPLLVFQYRIKTILIYSRKGVPAPITTFDWESIFLEACKNSLILERFLHIQHNNNRHA